MSTQRWTDGRWTVFSAALTGGRGMIDVRLDPNLLKNPRKAIKIRERVRKFADGIENTLHRMEVKE